ncbi:MAG: hypothetical protein IPN62_16810 [Flavobacteriales bacterium]|nr:hypothetical protein [Flavobacteriales bacterium]
MAAGSFDVFLTKTDAAGNFIWAKRFGGTSQELARSVAVDGAGNVLITGQFMGTADFDPNAGTALRTATGSSDIFIAKLDPLGNLTWAHAIGGSDQDVGWDVTTDPAGNVHVCGQFSATVDLDPGAGANQLTATGSTDVFALKLDPAGGFVWAKGAGGVFPDVAYSLALDAAGNVITVGMYQTSVDFDPSAAVLLLPSAGQYDMFIWKLSPAGGLVWATRMGGIVDDSWNSVAVDALGNIGVTGMFNDVADLDPGAGTVALTSAGQGDIAMAKYTAAGALLWAARAGGSNHEVGLGIVADAAGDLTATGYFQSAIDFDPGPGVVMYTATGGGQDIFVLELSATGALNCVEVFGSSFPDAGYAIANAPAGSVALACMFSGSVDFDPTACTTILNSVAGSTDAGVVRVILCGSLTLPVELLVFDGVPEDLHNHLYWETATELNNDLFILEKSTDAVSWAPIATIDGAGSSQTTIHYDYFDPDIADQVHYYRLVQTDFDGTTSLSDVVAIARNLIELADFHPNPTTDGSVSITILSRLATDVTVIGRTAAGGVVMERTFHVTPGLNTFRITTEGFANALYHLQGHTASGLRTSVKQLLLAQ